jgi:2-keto-3-deoxy-galactonokinase
MTPIVTHTAPQTLGTAADRIVATLAAYVAERELEPGGQLLRGALTAAIRAGLPEVPIADVPAMAARLVDVARREQAEGSEPR